MNGARYFMRRRIINRARRPRASPFRQFDVTCVRCGSYEQRLVSQMDEEAGEMALVLVCKKCRNQERIPVK
jgi:transcription elongation factor Elf1